MISSKGCDISVNGETYEHFVRNQRGVGGAEKPDAASYSRLLPYHTYRKDKNLTPIRGHTPLIINGFFLFAHKPWIDIPLPPALRNVTGHIAESTGLLAGRTVIRRSLCSKSIIAIRTFPLSH